MICRQCKNLIHEYFGGDVRVKSDILSHLASCSRCEQYYRQMLKIDRQLKRKIEQPVPDEFRYAWRSAVNRQPQKRKFQYKFLIPALAGVLCCVFVITAFATGGFTIRSQSNVMLSGAKANEETGAQSPEVAQAPVMEDAQGMMPQDEREAEASINSELTESTIDSNATAAPSAENAPQASASSHTGSGQAFSLAVAPEKIQAASTDKQALLQKANELGIALREQEAGIFLEDDGTDKIDQLLKEFGLSRKNSGVDVEIVFA